MAENARQRLNRLLIEHKELSREMDNLKRQLENKFREIQAAQEMVRREGG